MSDLCEHGYIIRASKGKHRYLCKECNERFERHPFATITPPAVLCRQEADVETARKEEIAILKENAKAAVNILFPNDKEIQKRIKQRPLGQKYVTNKK